jgi:hypothetical protein
VSKFTCKSRVLTGKVTANHSTTSPSALALIRVVKAWPEVSKIALAKISRALGPARLKCTPVPAGLLVKVRAGGSTQDLYVYTLDHDGVIAKLRVAWAQIAHGVTILAHEREGDTREWKVQLALDGGGVVLTAQRNNCRLNVALAPEEARTLADALRDYADAAANGGFPMRRQGAGS